MDSSVVTLLDAGMGRTLSMKGIEIPPTIWSANALLVAPEIVKEVHLENIQAGAKVITTNSYGIILADLAKINIEDQYESLNILAGKLAVEAVTDSGKSVEIAASLPPQNGSYRSDLVLDRSVIEPLYRRQAKLLEPFVDIFLCETMSSIDEAISAAAGVSGLGKPVYIGLTLHDEKSATLRSGESLQSAVQALADFNVAGILANCCLPERISDAIPLLAASGVDFFGGYANAFTRVPQDWLLGGEKEFDGRLTMRDDLSPEFYSEFVVDWIAKGANFVGGCCGTTAKHIQAISEKLRA
ncbi:MAG: homocysteine S-methyltransferase family protein [Gammaproteobacteria bacterium]|jgi:S-methylmethionine-dependent homocysteine/selenocysteine methylase|nr:homocysteine S-methyltransferase family protein [Gammaproteobacteria bacterium]